MAQVHKHAVIFIATCVVTLASLLSRHQKQTSGSVYRQREEGDSGGVESVRDDGAEPLVTYNPSTVSASVLSRAGGEAV
ncbi:hypothetical protein BIW11_02586 [Tropilaelaps mercedesae]|uniref:Secreted protein n=1 Tax=Tropilaelaps mercedesae TaxID=418985 RepID=A0A1V9Y0K3_9ACAR|nr:hypothetical protein BIW11_02586 [Tropilaelaps mercedesae]